MKNVFILIFILTLYFPFKSLSQENSLLCSIQLQLQTRPGDIYLYKEFELHDGRKAEKLLIAVNFPLNGEVYFLKPTTKMIYSETKEGCTANAYMLPSLRDQFGRDTWIDFKEVYKFKVEDLLKDKSRSLMHYKATLRVDTIKNVLICFIKSQYFENPQNFSPELRSQQNSLRWPAFKSVVQALNAL